MHYVLCNVQCIHVSWPYGAHSYSHNRDITLPTKVHIVKTMIFPVVMYECDSWTIKKAERQRIDAFKLWFWRRLLRVPLDSKEIKPVNPKWNQLWVKTWKDWCWSWSSDTLATWWEEWTHWKDPDAGKDWRQEKKGATRDEMARWHHLLNKHEFEQTPRVSQGQGSLVCSTPWGHKELDTAEWLSNNNGKLVFIESLLWVMFWFSCSCY